MRQFAGRVCLRFLRGSYLELPQACTLAATGMCVKRGSDASCSSSPSLPEPSQDGVGRRRVQNLADFLSERLNAVGLLYETFPEVFHFVAGDLGAVTGHEYDRQCAARLEHAVVRGSTAKLWHHDIQHYKMNL